MLKTCQSELIDPHSWLENHNPPSFADKKYEKKSLGWKHEGDHLRCGIEELVEDHACPGHIFSRRLTTPKTLAVDVVISPTVAAKKRKIVDA